MHAGCDLHDISVLIPSSRLTTDGLAQRRQPSLELPPRSVLGGGVPACGCSPAERTQVGPGRSPARGPGRHRGSSALGQAQKGSVQRPGASTVTTAGAAPTASQHRVQVPTRGTMERVMRQPHPASGRKRGSCLTRGCGAGGAPAAPGHSLGTGGEARVLAARQQQDRQPTRVQRQLEELQPGASGASGIWGVSEQMLLDTLHVPWVRGVPEDYSLPPPPRPGPSPSLQTHSALCCRNLASPPGATSPRS